MIVRLLIAYKYVIRCIENFSISIVYGLYFFGKGHLNQENYARFVQYDALAQDYLNATQQFSSTSSESYNNFIGHRLSRNLTTRFPDH